MKNTCSICGYEMDSATCIDDFEVNLPKEGDISICLKCGGVFVFGSDLILRNPTEDEWIWINTDELIDRTVMLIKTNKEEW